MNAEAKIVALRGILESFDARKPLPQMSQLATAALALNHCLNVIDAVRDVLNAEETEVKPC